MTISLKETLLEAAWDNLMAEHQINPSDLRDLIATERRLAMARAIRFVACSEDVDLCLGALHELADRIELGEVKVPE